LRLALTTILMGVILIPFGDDSPEMIAAMLTEMSRMHHRNAGCRAGTVDSWNLEVLPPHLRLS
jgi:hypothetical protein